MSALPDWGALYAAFDDVALAALASRGLVRRARAEVAAGRVEARETDQEAVTVVVGRPGVEVVLTADGPAQARCPCPVAGVCVHVVAACLWARQAVAGGAALPEAAPPGAAPPGAGTASSTGPAGSTGTAGTGAPGSGPESAGAPAGSEGAGAPAGPEDAGASAGPEGAGPGTGADDPVLAQVLTWDPATVSRSLGAAAVRRATTALAGTDPARLAADTLVARAPGRLSVSWPGSPQVVVVAGLGPAGMVVSGRHSQVAHATWRLQAVVRLFALAGRAWPWEVRQATLSAGQRRLLASVAATLEGVVAAGISHAGPRSADELSSLAQAARLEEVPRLARLLTSAAGAVRAVARRDDAVQEDAALSALAAAWSLARALEASDADPALTGRAGTQQAQPGLLVPLAATWWSAVSGSRGLTVRLWDAENHRLESVTTGRAAGTDPTFRRSEDAVLLWGVCVRTLLAGPLRLTGAIRRGDGTLAPSARTTVTRCGGYDGIDLAGIARELGALRHGPQVAGFEAPPPPVTLLLTCSPGLGRIDLDELHQQYVWPVRDLAGQDHLLRLGAEDASCRLVAAVLARDLPVDAVALEGDRPAGILVRDRGVPTLLSPTISSVRADDPGLYRRLAGRMERLRSEVRTLPPPETGPVQALCDDVRETLTALAASGAPRAQGAAAHVLVTRARTARGLQLQTLAAALDKVEAGCSPQALLRACALVDRVRALAR